MIPQAAFTTEHVHQQGADATTVGLAHIECAGERQNHNEPKQELRDSLHGFLNPLGLSREVSGHSKGRSSATRQIPR
jgi:hypothetical protein